MLQEAPEQDLLGKQTSDLQTGVGVSGETITGTLHHQEGYTGFSSIAEEQEGYYFGFTLAKTGTKMTFKKNGVVTKENIAWEADNIFRVESTGTKFEVLVDGVSVLKLDFSNINFG